MTDPRKPYDHDEYRNDFTNAFVWGGVAFIVGSVFFLVLLDTIHVGPIPEGDVGACFFAAVVIAAAVVWGRVAEAEKQWGRDAPRRAMRDIAEQASRKRRELVDEQVSDVEAYARRLGRQ